LIANFRKVNCRNLSSRYSTCLVCSCRRERMQRLARCGGLYGQRAVHQHAGQLRVFLSSGLQAHSQPEVMSRSVSVNVSRREGKW